MNVQLHDDSLKMIKTATSPVLTGFRTAGQDCEEHGHPDKYFRFSRRGHNSQNKNKLHDVSSKEMGFYYPNTPLPSESRSAV